MKSFYYYNTYLFKNQVPFQKKLAKFVNFFCILPVFARTTERKDVRRGQSVLDKGTGKEYNTIYGTKNLFRQCGDDAVG